MQKEPVPTLWAGEFPHAVFGEIGVFVKVIVAISRHIYLWLELDGISNFKHLGRR
jgi:hypothetical protein